MLFWECFLPRKGLPSHFLSYQHSFFQISHWNAFLFYKWLVILREGFQTDISKSRREWSTDFWTQPWHRTVLLLSVNIICKLSSTAVGTVEPYTARNCMLGQGNTASQRALRLSEWVAEQHQWSKRELLGLSRAAWGLFKQNHSSFNLWVPEGCDSCATQYQTQDFTDASSSHKSGVTVKWGST